MSKARVLAVSALLLGLTGMVVAGEEPPLAWRLETSDLVHFDRRTVTRRNGAERPGRAVPFTVHGHDLRDGGQYEPVDPRRGDIADLLAMRIGPRGRFEKRFALRGVVPMRLTGTIEIEPSDDGVVIRAKYAFASAGRPGKGDTHAVRTGVATVRSVFDAEAGLLREARIDLSFGLVTLDAKPGTKPARFEVVRTYHRKGVLPTRYDGFQADVDAAIEKGVKHLRTLQKPDGSFEPHGNWIDGTTALAAFTLASCDVAREDPALEKALAFLVGREPDRTYEQALALLALDRAYTPASELQRERLGRAVERRRDLPEGRRAWAARTAAALERGARSPGVWSYPQLNPRALLQSDSSNTQYAVLGLRAATRLGLDVQESTWTGVIRYFRQARERDGPRGVVLLDLEGSRAADERASAAAVRVPEVLGFRYSTRDSHPRAWASMTCAGITGLAVAREQLRALGSRRLDRRLEREVEEMMSSGWAWLDTNWAMDRHAGKTGTAWYYYYLYSLERAGVLCGVRRVGGKDWYFEGAAQLLVRQKKNGSWNEGGGKDISETCFALLFLKRATAPITPSGPR